MAVKRPNRLGIGWGKLIVMLFLGEWLKQAQLGGTLKETCVGSKLKELRPFTACPTMARVHHVVGYESPPRSDELPTGIRRPGLATTDLPAREASPRCLASAPTPRATIDAA